MRLDAPQTLDSGRYALKAPLGDGGMASVFRAWDQRLRVWRAVKLLRPELAHHASARQRFDQEARAMARLQHPNILAVHDVGQDGATPFLVMDLAPGGSLADHVATSGPLHPALACRFTIELLRALDHAHAEGVIHRDVKPHNVLIAADGRALVSDFGIARVLDSESGLTRTGATMGTLAYMAPEQRGSAATVDGKADVYAAAGTLYHLLTGREPLDLYVHREGAFADVPQGLLPLIERSVQYEPASRPTASELADGLQDLLPSLGDAPAFDIAATPAPHPRSDSDTWSEDALDDSIGAETSGTWAMDEPDTALPPVVTPPAPPAPRKLWWALLPVPILFAGAIWWATPATESRLNHWTHSERIEVPNGTFFCSPDGQLGWKDEDGQTLLGPLGQAEPLGLDAEQGVAFDRDRRRWLVESHANRFVLEDGAERREFPFPNTEETGGWAVGPGAQRALMFSQAGMVWAETGSDQSNRITDGNVMLADLSPDATQAVALGHAGRSVAVTVYDLQTGAANTIAEGQSLLGPGHVGLAWLDDGRVAWMETPEGQATRVHTVDPNDPDAQIETLFDLDPDDRLMFGSGNHLCVTSLAQHHTIRVVGSTDFDLRQEHPVDELDTIVAGWASDTRVQLAFGDDFTVWDLPTDSVNPGLEWQRQKRPKLDWDPLKLRCTDSMCIALDDTPRGRAFTPVDVETGEPGAPWPAQLGSGTTTFALSDDGDVAAVVGGRIQVFTDQGRSVRNVGLLGLSEVMDVSWAPGGGLWVSGGLANAGSAILHWTPEQTRTLYNDPAFLLHHPTASPDGELAAYRAIELNRMEVRMVEGSSDP